jgi:hypothetical protein
MKHARAAANGYVVLEIRESSVRMSLAFAKSVRDDLSEAIYEAEGGDPAFSFALDHTEAKELLSLIDEYALESGYPTKRHAALRARLYEALSDETTRAQLERESKE